MQDILRIDMGAPGGPAASLEVLGRYTGLAGRAIASRILADEVELGCPPLVGANRLVIAPGRRAGVPGASAALVAIGCASPLSGDLVVSQAEGPPATALARLGFAAVIVHGQPDGTGLWKIVIDGRGVSFSSARGLGGLGNLAAVGKLRQEHGRGAAYLTIGSAGEARLAAASVSCPGGAQGTRHCGRGGAGAVMGSKRLKAIVIDAGAAPGAPRAPAARDAAADEGASYRDACGIDDPWVLGQLRRMEDDLGVESAEVAGAVGVAMEAGLARFGDGNAALRLLAEVGRGTPLGRILGSGALVARNALGLAAEPAAASVFGVPEEDLARLVETLVPARATTRTEAAHRTPPPPGPTQRRLTVDDPFREN